MITQRTEAPVIGYRWWRVTLFGNLRAAGPSVRWPNSSGVMEALCAHERHHRAPAADCSCGIAACNDLETARRLLRHWHRWLPWTRLQRHVLGAVLVWGDTGRPVIVGEVRPDLYGRAGLQFRAPFARIVALSGGRRVARLARKLGVPIVRRADYLEAVAREISGGVQLKAAHGSPRWWLRLGRLALRGVFGLGFLLGLTVVTVARLWR